MEPMTIPLRDIALEAIELLKTKSRPSLDESLLGPVQKHVDLAFRKEHLETEALAEFSERFLHPAMAALSRRIPRDAVFRPLARAEGIDNCCASSGGVYLRVAVGHRLIHIFDPDDPSKSVTIEDPDERTLRIDVLLHPAEVR